MLADVSLDEALLRIDECERRGAPVLGLEWFYRRSDKVVPAGILDLSGAPTETTWAEARRMLAAGIPDGADTVEVNSGLLVRASFTRAGAFGVPVARFGRGGR